MRSRRSVQVESLYREVRWVLEQARASAYRAVNFAMVGAYWQVGRLIVEHEQGGRTRAAYGEALIEDLSLRLTSELGRGFDTRNLRYMRQFFLAFPIRPALNDESKYREKLNAPRSESDMSAKWNALRSKSSNAVKRDASGLEAAKRSEAPCP